MMGEKIEVRRVTTFEGAEPTFQFYGEPPSYALLRPEDIVLMRFDGRMDDGYRQKLIGEGTTVERVTVAPDTRSDA